MIFRLLFLSLFCFVTVSLFCQDSILVPDQDENFPLYSKLDTAYFKKFLDDDSDSAVSMIFKYLNSLYQENDVLATYILATMYGEARSYTYEEDDEAAKWAIQLYREAAEQNFGQANLDMYYVSDGTYFVGRGDTTKCKYYLRRAAKYGSPSIKASAYEKLGSMLYEQCEEYEDSLKQNCLLNNKDSIMFYMLGAYEYEPDPHSVGFIGYLYEIYEEYEKAMEYYLLSNNDQHQLEVAEWLIEGKHLEQDIDKGISLVFQAADDVLKDYSLHNVHEYMGGRNPVWMLNNYYKEGIIKNLSAKYILPY